MPGAAHADPSGGGAAAAAVAGIVRAAFDDASALHAEGRAGAPPPHDAEFARLWAAHAHDAAAPHGGVDPGVDVAGALAVGKCLMDADGFCAEEHAADAAQCAEEWRRARAAAPAPQPE
eukprot:gene1627-24092_t